MTDEELDALVKSLRKLGGHGFPNWADDAAAAITTLRAQLADQKRFKDRIVAEALDALEAMRKRCEAANARAESALAAQIEVDAWICDDVRGDSAKTTDERMIAQECEARIRNQPHDHAALDAMKRAAKVEAWKEAADLVGNAASGFPDNVAWCVEDLAAAILALIEREDGK